MHAVATSTEISLCIEILLKVVNLYFELHYVYFLHFSHKGIGKLVMMDEKIFMYLALAETRQFFAIITLYMITSTYESYNVCLFDMVLRTAEGQNCLC